MAIRVSFTITNVLDCTQVYFEDTSNYDSVTNPYADVTVADLVIIDPAGDTYTVDLLTQINAGDMTYTITGLDIGLAGDATIPDGVYQFSYNVVNPTPASDLTTYLTFLNTCTIDCCIAGKIIDIEDLCCNDCINDSTITYTKLLDLYDAMLFNFECGKYTEVTTLLTYMTRICSLASDSNCPTC